MERPTKPLVIYDGDCGFCLRWIERWRESTGDRVDYAPAQEVGARFPDIAPERFQESVVLVETDGSIHVGADAVFRALASGGAGGKLAWLYANVPGFGAASEAVYGFAARNRRFSSTLTRMLWGREPRRPRHELVRWTLLRGLGLIYFMAFVSLWFQLDGLVGSNGILPAASWLDWLAERYGSPPYARVPTLLWLDPGDRGLHVIAAVGTLGSALLVANMVPLVGSLLAWACYLSLYTVGRTFLSFQWDILLLEIGLLAVLLAPWQLRPGMTPRTAAPWTVILLVRWLLFRLMFMSGVVKLLSSDVAWWDLTALVYHYETQPLPAWTSWYMHQLPVWQHQLACAVMFGIELALPFLIFAPRRPRFCAFVGLVALQVVIIATGNYCFFNLLTILLCVSLLDDAYLVRWFPERVRRATGEGSTPQPRATVGRAIVATIAVVLVVLSSARMYGRIAGFSEVPAVMRQVLTAVGPFHVTNGYGLFAVMTKKRPEIIIEGSNDGEKWLPYEFKWKPGELTRRPTFIAPHQPRVDWQMWFAALGDHRRNPWLTNMMHRLLQGSPAVLGLLGENPFSDEPPRHVRAVVYDYRFSDRATRDAEGKWWTRANPRLYAPTLSRR